MTGEGESSGPIPPHSTTVLFPTINSGTPVFHFRSAVYIAANTFALLARILKATAIVLKCIYYINIYYISIYVLH